MKLVTSEFSLHVKMNITSNKKEEEEKEKMAKRNKNVKHEQL